MQRVEICGKTYTLTVNLRVIAYAEERYGSIVKVMQSGRMAEMMDVAAFAATEGAKAEGREDKITREQLDGMTMMGVMLLTGALKQAIEDSMRMETDNEIRDVPKDAYLEELQKNE